MKPLNTLLGANGIPLSIPPWMAAWKESLSSFWFNKARTMGGVCKAPFPLDLWCYPVSLFTEDNAWPPSLGQSALYLKAPLIFFLAF